MKDGVKPLPLKPLQRSMVLASRRAPASGVYLIQDVCELNERCDVQRLLRAWQIVTKRHPALRSKIEFDGDNPVALGLVNLCNIEWQELDWTALPAEQQERQMRDFLLRDRQRGFDLQQGVPMRIAVISTTADASTLIWSSHHALLDGRSYLIVWREWLAAYDSLARDEEVGAIETPVLDPVPALDLVASEQHWRRCFDGISQTTDYIVDRTRVFEEPETERIAKELRCFSRESTEQLRALARAHQVSLNNLVQGAWSLLLSRYGAQSEVVIGVTHAGRSRGAESLVGFFINSIPMRVDVRSQMQLGEWLRQIRANAVAARSFENTPLDQISKWSGLPTGMRPFESVLVFDHATPEAALRAMDCRWENRTLRRFQRTDSPLTLAAYGDPVLSLELIFDTHLFSRRTMRAVADHLKTLLESFLAQPDARLCEIEMLTEAERPLFDAQNIAPQVCAHELFERQVQRTPEKVALDLPGGSLSYTELNQRANRLAQWLRTAGAALEDLIAIVMEPSAETIVAILAVLKSGAAFLPIDPSLPPERLRALLADARPRFVFPENFPADAALDSQPVENLENISSPANAAYAIYTSGSTGAPKAAVVLHRGLSNHTIAAAAIYGIRETDRRLQFASIGTDFFVAEVFNYLCHGATLVFGWNRKGSVREFLSYLTNRRITITGIPSAWWNEWVAAMELGDLSAPESLRAVIIGMEKANPAALASWKNLIGTTIRLFNAYGPTEASLTATIYEAGSSIWEGKSIVPIGRPIENVRAYILDRDGNPLPSGVAGQLYIGGAGVARGYLNAPELTQERFVADRFSADPDSRLYATGDIVFSLPDGDLVFLGRADRQVKIRGYRIELEEIEAALAEHPAIRQCAVILAKQSLVAFFAHVDGHAPAPGELRTHLSRMLPAHMVPANFVLLPTMPMTRSGKIDRQTLASMDLPSHAQEASEILTPIEKRVAEIWRQVLDVATVSAADNFFEMGGDSLRATRLITLLEASFAGQVVTDLLWRAPTLASMAALIEKRIKKTTSPVVVVQATGSRVPLFCVSAADESPARFWHLARGLGINQPVYVLRDPRPVGDRGVYTVEEVAERLIAALKECRPRGPYVVGGHCYGGIVAFEMARQLIANGEDVRLVVLFETAVPGYPKVLRHWKSYCRYAFELAVRSPHVAVVEARAHIGMLRKLLNRETRMIKTRVFIKAGWRAGLKQSEQPNAQAGLSYRPERLACHVSQFLAADERHSTRILMDPRLGWRDLVEGEFSIRETPGTGETIFLEPQVHELAARLSEVLNSVNITSSVRAR